VDTETLRSAIAEPARKVGAIAVYLHGSHAAGKARPDSDIDLAILMPHGADFELAAERLAEALAGLPVDVQDLREAPPLFRVRVYFEGLCLFVSDPTELARHSAPSLSEHLDTEYFLAPMREAMRKRIREGKFAAG
jgi:predicted nucleotidyltransferase